MGKFFRLILLKRRPSGSPLFCRDVVGDGKKALIPAFPRWGRGPADGSLIIQLIYDDTSLIPTFHKGEEKIKRTSPLGGGRWGRAKPGQNWFQEISLQLSPDEEGACGWIIDNPIDNGDMPLIPTFHNGEEKIKRTSPLGGGRWGRAKPGQNWFQDVSLQLSPDEEGACG